MSTLTSAAAIAAIAHEESLTCPVCGKRMAPESEITNAMTKDRSAITARGWLHRFGFMPTDTRTGRIKGGNVMLFDSACAEGHEPVFVSAKFHNGALRSGNRFPIPPFGRAAFEIVNADPYLVSRSYFAILDGEGTERMVSFSAIVDTTVTARGAKSDARVTVTVEIP